MPVEVLPEALQQTEEWRMPRYANDWPLVLVKGDYGKHTMWSPAVIQKDCGDCLEVSRIGYQWANLMPMTVYHYEDPRLKDPERRKCMIGMDDEMGIFKLYPAFELLDKTVMGLCEDVKSMWNDLHGTDTPEDKE